MTTEILQGDCRDVLAGLEADSFHACVTDPPYHLTSGNVSFDGAALGPHPNKRPNASTTNRNGRGHKTGFMGKAWDGGDVAFQPETWAAVLRVLKPGAHLLAFGGTRTFHRLACAIEDAGFEIRDTIMWIYASGFPKSLDVSKALDRKRDDATDIDVVRAWLEEQRQRSGLTRKSINETLGLADNGGGLMSSWTTNQTTRAVPQWHQWLQLKVLLDFGDDMDAEVWRLNGRKGQPGEAWQTAEVIETREAVDIRNGHGREYGAALFAGEAAGKIKLEKRAANSAVSREWRGWGTGLKPACEPICVARKPLSEGTVAANVLRHGIGALNVDASRIPSGGHIVKGGGGGNGTGWGEKLEINEHRSGRFPANVAHDGSPEVLDAFARFGERTSGAAKIGPTGGDENERFWKGLVTSITSCFADTGTAARFFFCAKADASERVTSEYETVTIEWADQRREIIVCVDQSQPKAIDVSGNGKDNPQKWSTWLFGNGLTDLCQTAAECITSTSTSSTTVLRTWNWLMRSLTNASIAVVSSTRTDGGSRAENAENSTMSLTITAGLTGSLPGAEHVTSGTPLRISVSARPSAGHPTVKPVELMEWLVRLVCPPNGKVLDPFCGTGSTLVACDRLGFDATGIEQDAQTVADAHEKLRRMRARRMIGDVTDRTANSENQLRLFA